MNVQSSQLAKPCLGILFIWVLSIQAGIVTRSPVFHLPFVGESEENSISSTVTNHEMLDILDHITLDDLNASVTFAVNIVGYMKRLENNLLSSNIKVADDTPSHGMFISYRPEAEALERGKNALIALRASNQLLNIYCHRLSKASSSPLTYQDCAKLVSSRFTFKNTQLDEACQLQDFSCDQKESNSLYRSINGSCNNAEKGHNGESFTGYSRLLYADYSDGVHEPRRSVTKQPLPNPRSVVNSLIKTGNKPSWKATLALMQWSQFLEHDLCRSATAVAIHTESPIECCSTDGVNLTPRYVHPFCSPIYVTDDKKYAKEGVTCLNFVRSIPAIRSDCSFGASDQINQATHYLDGSQIYGTTLRRSDELRTFTGGKLLTSTYEKREFLPLSRNPTQDCQLFYKNSTCFESGDARVNFQPQLTLVHTLWYREHNRIAEKLGQLNPHWNDEKLFQESRRIVVAEMQKITYSEWLPSILGPTAANKILSSSTSYNKESDASVSNAFATAVMRSVKSLSDGMPKLYDENRTVNESIFMRNYFHNPGLLRHKGILDSLARGLTTQSSQRLDVYFPDDLINQLYTNGKYGFDVLSFDLQRGRDHGLPSYADYRKACGLEEAHNFADFSDAISNQDILALQHIYSSPRDVDLIIGGLLEKARGDSLFGPTFTCIVADQMLRTRQGDRYFYNNKRQPNPFSKSQLAEIENISFARIICDNTDDVQQMQKKVFERITKRNNLVDCSSSAIPKLNLNHWQEFEYLSNAVA